MTVGPTHCGEMQNCFMVQEDWYHFNNSGWDFTAKFYSGVTGRISFTFILQWKCLSLPLIEWIQYLPIALPGKLVQDAHSSVLLQEKEVDNWCFHKSRLVLVFPCKLYQCCAFVINARYTFIPFVPCDSHSSPRFSSWNVVILDNEITRRSKAEF